jgi:hypothetical protein
MNLTIDKQDIDRESAEARAPSGMPCGSAALPHRAVLPSRLAPPAASSLRPRTDTAAAASLTHSRVHVAAVFYFLIIFKIMNVYKLDTEKFIEEVRKLPQLWDLNCEDYRYKVRKQRAWMKVANECITGFDDFLESEKQITCK